MLVHALILSALLSIPTAILTYLTSNELSVSGVACALVASAVCIVCAYGELCIMSAQVNGRVARARYQHMPIDRIIEHLPSVPSSPTPVPERLRFIRLRSHADYKHSTNLAATPLVAPPILENPPSRYGVDVRDLEWFVRGLTTKGSHSRRRWENKVAPSGRVVDATYHALLVTPLVTCGAITGRAERRAGSLICTPDEILGKLGLV